MRISDEKLVKRAHDAFRNLAALAFLAAVGAVGLFLLAFGERNTSGYDVVLPAGMLMAAVAYCILAAAARRGDPRSVGVVIAFLAIQVSATLLIPVAAGRKSDVPGTPLGLIIALLIMLVLFKSYQVLQELRKRDLWVQVFGESKPAGRLCAVGGVLLGFVWMAFVGSAVHQGYRLKALVVERQQAEAFVAMIKGEDQEFLAAMNPAGGVALDLPEALKRFDNLERKASVLQVDASRFETLAAIVKKYGEAIGVWKEGLRMLGRPDTDLAQVRGVLQRGDKMRTEALRQFDAAYAK